MRSIPLALLLALTAAPLAWAQPPVDDTFERPPADASAAAAATVLPVDPTVFEPRYTLERIEVRGNHKTRTPLILDAVGLAAGDVVAADDPRVELARLRLLALGYFLDARLSLSKGTTRGSAVLVVEVEERGTIILNAIHLGTSEATPFWGGLDVTERNFLGRGLSLGGGFVASTRPRVDDARPGMALSARIAGPPKTDGVVLSGSVLFSHSSEFFRARGSDDEPAPDDFVALNTRRVGGTLGLGMVLSRTVYLSGEARFEMLKASLPGLRLRELDDGTQPIPFDIREGASRLGSLSLSLDVDTRSDPVLPRWGHHLVISLEAAAPELASQYTFVKAVAQGAVYLPLRFGHALGLHGMVGGIAGDAPFFEQFFVGDLNLLLPPRALGTNFSTQPSRDFLGTSIASRRYDDLAARVMVEYSVPLWKRHGPIYRGSAFVALGAFVLANSGDFHRDDRSWVRSLPADLTADLGLRLDTYIGLFTLSVGNALGRIPL